MTGGIVGTIALAIVGVALMLTVVVQRRPLRRHRIALDMLGMVPEWRFYAQASIAGVTDFARDTHLVIRDSGSPGAPPGGWRPLLWPVERRVRHALWNPHGRVDAVILSLAEDLALACASGAAPQVQQSQAYLVLLRRAFEAPGPEGGGTRQFAVVHAVGRGVRTLSIDFVSAWHPR